MNQALLLAAIALLALGLAAYPPGLSPLYAAPDEALQVSVPPSLVARGYPPYVAVSRSYLETRFQGSYAGLLNSTFTEAGIVDESGRVIEPAEAWRTVIGRSSSVAVNYVKIAFLLSAVILLAAAAAATPGRSSRAEPVGGYAP